VSSAEGREKEALAILEKGKEKFPGNTDLLFAEINYFLKMEKLSELIGKLETAIEKEPDNVSLYTTLGNVYDNLYSRETEAGNDERATEYFDKALKYYKAAVEKAPDMADAVYSIGALYFNKAVVYNKSIQELEGEGFSKENLAKMEDMEAKRDKLFDEALPHFKKAEKMNPNDQNTLIALKEIFARKNQLDLSKEFKTRLENVQKGVKNEPYFNK
jgi:tetratricopeptide (TPR) repeat protein